MSTASYFPVPFHLQASTQQYAPQMAAVVTVPPVNVPAVSVLPEVTVPPVNVPVVNVPVYATATPSVGGVYSLPQYQQVQQLFQKDAQIITPEAIENVKAALASSEVQHKAETKKRAIPCKAAGQTWEDPTLADWPESKCEMPRGGYQCRLQMATVAAAATITRDDFRLFCGDLGNEVNDDVLARAFSRYPSFDMARVVRDKRTGKTKGYGFVSFANSADLVSALKEMNGKYVGNRPIKLRKSTWKNRIDFEALEKQKNQPQKKPKLVKKSVLHK